MIASDLDGTLIGANGQPNARDLDALHRARREGFFVTICTGRNVTESRRVMDALGLEGPGVFVNGAAICAMPDGRAIARHTLEDALVERAIELLGGLGIAVMLLTEDPGTGLPHYYATDHGQPHRGAISWLKHNRMVAEPWPRTGPRPAVMRVGVVIDSPDEPAVTRLISEQLGGHVTHHGLHSPSQNCHVVELFGPRVSKWSGLEQVARMQGIDPATIVVLGDDSNDISMLRGASLSFAMGTASAEVRSHAKRVTASQPECGVAQAVEGLLEGRW